MATIMPAELLIRLGGKRFQADTSVIGTVDVPLIAAA